MKVALVLGSGSAKGYAHIGVIEELKARGHEIVAISGTSMGAVIGGLEAAGGLEEFTEWARSLRQFDVLRNLDFALGRGGVVKANRIIERIDALCGSVRIEDLPIPFTAVATDITARREVWFQRGPLAAAMRASMSMPGFITPVMLGDHVLVDGAVLNPVPVEPTLSVPADITIAVSLHGRSDLLGVQILADAGELASAPEEREDMESDGDALRARIAARVAALFSRSDSSGSSEAQENEAGEAAASADAVGAEASLLERLERLEAALAAADGSLTVPAKEPGTTEPASGAEGGHASPGMRGADDAAAPGDLLVSARSVSMYDVMELSLSTMEDALERVRAAVAPAHVRIEIPEDVCSALDFHRAAEVIEVGRALAIEAFDRAGL